MASVMGVTRGAVAHWEQGRVVPSNEYYEKVLELDSQNVESAGWRYARHLTLEELSDLSESALRKVAKQLKVFVGSTPINPGTVRSMEIAIKLKKKLQVCR